METLDMPDGNDTQNQPYRLPLHIQNSRNEGRIIHSIASFLSLSDAASVASGLGVGETPIPESWMLGTPTREHMETTLIPSIYTPPSPAPALVAISPNTERSFDDKEDNVLEVDVMQQEQRRAWAKEKLAAAVFSHPQSLRNFCVDAYLAAKEISRNQLLDEDGSSPETSIEPRKQKIQKGYNILEHIIHHIVHNVPLSVYIDIIENITELSLDTSGAVFRISGNTINGILSAVFDLITTVWDRITHFNPLTIFRIIVSGPFNAMEKTTEVVVSGIQSVATGVGSASSLALYRLSARATPSSNFGRQSSLRRSRSSPGNALNEKLLKKLSILNSAASVIAYTESNDDTGGLDPRTKSRVQRMMHYDISLRPFVATVKLPVQESAKLQTSPKEEKKDDEDDSQAPSTPGPSSPGSPFMCTPQSFPPTPASRKMVLARGTRFSDDVVFLARDQLRIDSLQESENERTAAMAQALYQGRRLAVFDADDASAGIDLTCGQHVATKVGNMLYCSTRSMVPILRNCFVYFEMTVLPRPGGKIIPQAHMATLSVGLSTKEMPPNHLVGAWQGSVGLCTTGQILAAGQWCSPVDPLSSSYGDHATVGCLVCLDDGSAFETWDGVMVTAAVTFNVNEQIISPPVSTQPIAAVGVSSAEPNAHTPATPVGPVPPSFTLPLLVPADEELYPTITLHSPGVAVMSRFSAADLLATTRDAIGAPPGVTVYCVDGSVILKESE